MPVAVLYEFEVPRVVVEQVVPSTSLAVVFIVALVAVQCCLIVTEEEVKGFDSAQACVFLAFLIAPEDGLLCLDFDRFELLDDWLSKVISCLRPSRVYQHNFLDLLQLVLCHLSNFFGIVAWEE